MEPGCLRPVLTAAVIVVAVVLTILQPWKLGERPVREPQEADHPPPPGMNEPEDSEGAAGRR